MNGEYSKVNFPELRKWRKIYKKNIALYESLKDLKRNSIKKQKDFSKYYQMDFNLLHQSFIWDFIEKNNYNNIFIDDNSLFDFLKSINIKITANEVMNFIDRTPTFINQSVIHPILKIKCESFPKKVMLGIIHAKNIKDSIFFKFIYDPGALNRERESCLEFMNEYFVVFDINDESLNQTNNNTSLFINEGETFLNDNYYKKMNESIKLILNMLFYINAFPKCVLNKPPDVVCDKLNINNSKTISMSKEIADYLHENRDVSPHLRRGHFRYLGSDHYKKKRGQTIFVKSSFVKGHAVTVIENKDSVNEINNIL
jgi:hypothetical protein